VGLESALETRLEQKRKIELPKASRVLRVSSKTRTHEDVDGQESICVVHECFILCARVVQYVRAWSVLINVDSRWPAENRGEHAMCTRVKEKNGSGPVSCGSSNGTLARGTLMNGTWTATQQGRFKSDARKTDESEGKGR
jgi:hypothetical protein